jgi:signal transduction histidine kinase/ActR/RegA family two-component response regulator
VLKVISEGDPHPCLAGGGVAGALMRSIDWSKNPLGPVESWPQSLRTIVGIMLASRFAMRVMWGPDLILLYNDSYQPVLGTTKLPGAMGRPTEHSFPELWDVVGPMFRRVYAGEAVALENGLLSIVRHGYLEECYFTLSYSPICDEGGTVAGLLGVVHESTRQVLADRRFETLAQLVVSASAAQTTEQACEAAAAVLEKNPADVPFSLFYLLSADGTSAQLVSRSGLAADSSAAPRLVALAENGSSWPFEVPASRDARQVVSDLRARFGNVHAGPYPELIDTAIVRPLFRPGSSRPHGFFVAGINPRRKLDDSYEGFFDFVVAHVVTAISNAEARREQSETESERERLHTFLMQVPAAIAIVRGPEQVFELANPLYCRLVGKSELVGKPGREALPELVEQGVWALLDNVYRTGEPYFGKEFPAKLERTGDGSLDQGYFNFTAQATRDDAGRIDGVLIFVVEITAQVTARKRVEAARAALESSEVERAALLVRERAARAEAELSSRSKDEFLAIVSHELRNPLSAMLGWTRMLRSGGLSEDRRERALETIERNAVNQSQLIEDLLDVSRIISGKLRLDVQNVDLSQVVEAALESARPALDAKQIELSAVIDTNGGTVMGDASRLQQVAWNLLANAAKFTNKGGRVRVVLSRIDSQLELSVTDTGKGIAADFLPLVFDRFKQADSTTTRHHGGLGLGLAIAKNLVEMHGGTIQVQSEGEGRGSSFVVRIPVSAMHHRSRITPVAVNLGQLNLESPPELVGLRVLVVDDEEDARDLVVTLLEHCGALVESAASVAKAWEMIELSPPDVLVSDIGLPGEDGYGLIRRVRGLAIDKGGATPAASLTAYAGIEDRRRAMMAGFNMHLPKPVEPSELIAVVTNLARLARAIARN